MTSGGILLVLFLLAIGALAVATLVVAVRGGRGPGDPPASRPHVDPAGFVQREQSIDERAGFALTLFEAV